MFWWIPYPSSERTFLSASAGYSSGQKMCRRHGWYCPAQTKKSMLNNPKHLILEAPHPSPLSAYRGFFGCRHFSKTNEFLLRNGLEPIDWQIENKTEQENKE